MIGIIMNNSFSEEGHDISYIYKDIVTSVTKYGAIPIPIVMDNYDIALKLIDMCDGVILQGGDNYTDKHLRIVNYLYDCNVPTLGICLGMQMMGCLFNGKLSKIEGHKTNLNYAHEVSVSKKSLLYKIVKKDKIMVNSRHKEYLCSTDLDVAAKSNVIEAIESKNRIFFLGVQWHPESMIEYDIVSNDIFSYFIKGCLYGFK